MANGSKPPAAAADDSGAPSTSAPARPRSTQRFEIEGYAVEGVSIAGHETCVMFPSLSLAFDIGRCPPPAVSRDLLFISHAHTDHIGGLPLHVATRGRRGMRLPTVFVPACLAGLVRRLFEVHRAMDRSDLDHKLVLLEVGEEYELRRDLRVRSFRTYHVVPSQVRTGYVIYKLKQKLKDEYAGLPGKELSSLRKSGVEIMNTVSTSEIAFTGDTMSDFILDPDNADVLKAKILVVESTYIDDSKSIEDAREKGHTHLSEIASLSDKLENKAILLNHFSSRYTAEDIDAAINRLPPSLRSRVHALKEGF
ncbi:nuclear ribonuclease Z-like [Panicum miliaceum]|uniref:Nuclear ribonuclease Z-like n=1 Tax=Panicum miliaceum TaxID=4540 RepID=A0A3L6RMN9_PANMI|nr:nuclear ribonuclease Z-like [Panicum miliaceum]